MKLNITSRHLVCAVLIQIILIDVLVVTFLFKSVLKSHEPEKTSAVDTNGKKSENSDKTHSNSDAGGTSLAGKVEDLRSLVDDMFNNARLKKPRKIRDIKLSNIDPTVDTFIATAYDLSYESCGKYPSHPEYGITFSGKKAIKGRTIAVDPEVIPLGSQVYIEFPSKYSTLDGWYVAEDTGSKVKGKIIDVFFGEKAFLEMEKFGSRRVDVKIVYPWNMIHLNHFLK